MVGCRSAILHNDEKGLWSGGAFETPLPERQQI